jgi:hypothetical protein
MDPVRSHGCTTASSPTSATMPGSWPRSPRWPVTTRR